MVNWDTDPDALAMDSELRARLRAVFEGPESPESSAELLGRLERLRDEIATDAEARGLTLEDVHAVVQRQVHPGRGEASQGEVMLA